jgi:hypothetical protein
VYFHVQAANIAQDEPFTGSAAVCVGSDAFEAWAGMSAPSATAFASSVAVMIAVTASAKELPNVFGAATAVDK